MTVLVKLNACYILREIQKWIINRNMHTLLEPHIDCQVEDFSVWKEGIGGVVSESRVSTRGEGPRKACRRSRDSLSCRRLFLV